MNLTEQDLGDWRLRYQTSTTDHDLSEESINKLVTLTSEAYKAKFGKDEQKAELDKLKAVAGVKVDTKAPKNEFTESLRNLAGIRR